MASGGLEAASEGFRIAEGFADVSEVLKDDLEDFQESLKGFLVEFQSIFQGFSGGVWKLFP